ncbi:membrane-flanked domain [Beggiatoa sp. PS]|nr:membrane-flanked domain [Beggiatoa sp. PS]
MKKKTLYEFLSIEPEATPEEIKAAAQKLARKFHPSKYPGNEKVAERFQKIKLVYKILANPKKRAAYDAILAKKMAQEMESSPNSSSSTKTSKTLQTQKKVVHDLIGNEAIVYQAKIHWFGYLKAFLMISIAAYFWFDPTWLKMQMNQFEFWDDNWWWAINMSLQIMLGFGVFILFRTLHKQLTTKLIITTERTIAKMGFIGKQQVNINHAKFEHIEIKPGILGTIFRFGTIKMRGAKGSRGVGGLEIHLSQIASPKQFEKRLMRVIKQSAYHQI